MNDAVASAVSQEMWSLWFGFRRIVHKYVYRNEIISFFKSITLKNSSWLCEHVSEVVDKIPDGDTKKIFQKLTKVILFSQFTNRRRKITIHIF